MLLIKKTPINIHTDGMWMAIGCPVVWFQVRRQKKKEPLGSFVGVFTMKFIAVTAWYISAKATFYVKLLALTCLQQAQRLLPLRWRAVPGTALPMRSADHDNVSSLCSPRSRGCSPLMAALA
ncbi:MAG: hypothetical protein K2X78_09560, partial [Burkholderiaceae bacterium]|nr:hypothetical protein [Burkholderiaceae bacterium]